MVEEPLAGGLVNEVVRVDATVRRRVGDHTAFVHALLGHLEGRGWAGAPRVMGFATTTWRRGTPCIEIWATG